MNNAVLTFRGRLDACGGLLYCFKSGGADPHAL